MSEFKNYRHLAWIAAIALFMQSLDATILNTALPAISHALNASPLNMQMAIISYSLTIALFIPLTSWLSDKFGTRRLFQFALLVFVLGSIACALAYSVQTLVAARILQGIGGAFMMPVARVAIVKNIPKIHLVEAWNSMAIAGLIGPVLGPIVGGWLVTNASWQWIFLINIPIGLLGILAANRYMPDSFGQPSKLDWRGFLLFSGGLTGLTLGLDLVAEQLENQWLAASILCAGLLFFGFYYAFARGDDSVILPLKPFHTRTFSLGMLANFFIRLAGSSIPFLLPLLFQVVFDYSAEMAGWLLAPVAIASILAKFVAGKLLHRFGYKYTLIGGSFGLALSVVLMGLLNAQTPLWYVCLLLAFYGACMSVIFTAINTLTICELDDHTASAGATYLSIMQQVGIGIGIAVASVILSFYRLHFGENQAQLLQAFSFTFFSVALFCIGLLATLSRLNKNDGENNLR